jgi:hypothetical protein
VKFGLLQSLPRRPRGLRSFWGRMIAVTLPRNRLKRFFLR